MVLLCATSVVSSLQIGFYRYSCGPAEFTVKDEVRKAFMKDKGVAAGLLRMHFRDCFVRASIYTYKLKLSCFPSFWLIKLIILFSIDNGRCLCAEWRTWL